MDNTLNSTFNYNTSGGCRYQVDFDYTDDNQGDVTIEAVFWVEHAQTNPDSDWESKPHYELEGYSVYKDGKIIFLDISEKMLYSALEEKIRELTIESEMNDNAGF